jgi:predicted acylesterase/phospholipase RssA
MCATLQERGESILLRSYTPPADAMPVSEGGKSLFEHKTVENFDISIATRATSAAPLYFPEVDVPTKDGTIVFWDGGLLNNNPIDQLWRARLDLVPLNDPAPKVNCVLSIGTSWCTAESPSFFDKFGSFGKWLKGKILQWIPILAPVEKLIPFLTNTEAKHLDFSRYMQRLSHRHTEVDAQTQYFRFNTPTGNTYIDMSDYKKMDDLANITKTWLASSDSNQFVNDCAKALAKTRK